LASKRVGEGLKPVLGACYYHSGNKGRGGEVREVDSERIRAWLDQNPLRMYRKAHGLTLFAAAGLLGVAVTSIQKWESGAALPSRASVTACERLIPGFWHRHSEWLNAMPEVTNWRKVKA
jgi:DNA-binding XRE family transcriptional regulator